MLTKNTFLISSLILISLNLFANDVYIKNIHQYNGIHRVSCYDKSDVNPEGFFLAYNEIVNEYGWHINYMGDGSTEIEDTSNDSNYIVLDNVKRSFGLKDGRSMTYDIRNQILIVTEYHLSFFKSRVVEYRDCVESDEIAIHNPIKW